MGIFLGNLVIASAGTNSTDLSGRILRTVSSLEIHGPATLTGTVKVQTPNDLTASPTYNDLQSGGADINIAVGEATVITAVPSHGIRVQSDGAEAAERTFPVFGEEKPHQ
jgi:hypothetical protein